MVTFPANDRIIQIVATSSQTVFAYDYPVLDQQDIVVVQNGGTLTITAEYTVQGVGDQGGGTITLVTPATVNDDITIYGDQPVERLTDFTIGGAFNADTINSELDKLTQQNQEQARDLDGTLRTDFDDAQRTLNPIPDKAARLDKVLGFDPTTGQPVVSTANHSDIDAFVGGVVTFEGRTGTVVSASGDYTASEIVNVAGGGIAATDVQAAIDELDTEKAASSHTHVLADVTDSGALAALDTAGSTEIDNGAVLNTKLADMAQDTIKGRITASTGDPEDLTATNVRTIINVADGADVTGANPPQAHAASHTDGTDDIQDATASVKGLATAAQITKLDGIETGATADQTDAEIKTAYENNADTNEFSDAEQTKLAGIAAGAEVNPDLISQAEAEAGTATTERIFSALRVAQAIAALETGGGASQLSDLSDVNTSTPTNRFVLVADGVDFESRLLVLADVSDSGALAALNTVDTAEIDNGAVLFAKMQNVKENSLLGRFAAGSGVAVDIDETDLTEEGTPAGGMFVPGWDASGGLVKFDIGDFPTGGGGEANTMSFPGTGVEIFAAKSGIDFPARDLVGLTTGGIDVVLNSDNIDFDLDIANMSADATPVGTDEVAMQTTGGGALQKATLTNLSKGIDHDQLVNFVSDKHVAHSSIDMIAGVGLSGGGTIDANRTFTVDLNELATEGSIASGDFIAMVDITDSGSGKITFANLESTVSHVNIAGVVANEHINHTSVDIATAASGGLSGGGDISATRNLAIAIGGITDETAPATGDEIAINNISGPNLRKTDLGTALKLATESFVIAVSDETTDLTTGTAKVTFRMPYAFTVDEVRASVTTAPTGSVLTVDINESAGSILSTKLTIDISEKTSETAAAPPIISDSSLADDAEMTIDIDTIGSTVAGAGLKVYIIGHQT